MKKLLQFKTKSYSFLAFLMLLSFQGFSQDTFDIQDENLLLVDESILKNKTSVFNHVYQMKGRPKIVIGTDMKKLVRDKMKEEYQETSFQLIDENGDKELDLRGRIRARGNMRKQVSYYPPVKIDFKKSTLDSLGFLKLDKLKLVFPKDRGTISQRRLLKEFFLYELYASIDSTSIRVKLVDVFINHKGKEKFYFTGFFIEDEKEYARRNNAIIVERGRVRSAVLDRNSFLKMVFFQYMISNTDYSVIHKHNLEIVKLPQVEKIVAVPYDFDYSGFVGQDYALPNPKLPISDVNQRYFFPWYQISEAEYNHMIEYFRSLEDDIYALCESSDYMDSRTIKESKSYLLGFFKLLKKPKRLKSAFVKK